MSIGGRILTHHIKNRLQCLKNLSILSTEKLYFATLSTLSKESSKEEKIEAQNQDHQNESIIKREKISNQIPAHFRFVYPEFLPDPNPKLRNTIREKLERKDMLARRQIINIPEFYVGSILAVSYSDIHAPGKSARFVGICIQKAGCGLRAHFVLRNHVDGEPTEISFNTYDPCIQKIECLKLEKRLDDDLLYLRDAPAKYCTIPFDLEPELILERKEVPVNPIKVPLNPRPWVRKYELYNYKGIQEDTIILNANRARKAKLAEKPWEKYDLMKIYRETIPEEEQNKIFSESYSNLHQLEINQQKQRRMRVFKRPKKTG